MYMWQILGTTESRNFGKSNEPDLNHPFGVFVDKDGSIFVSLYYNTRIIKVKVLND